MHVSKTFNMKMETGKTKCRLETKEIFKINTITILREFFLKDNIFLKEEDDRKIYGNLKYYRKGHLGGLVS